MEPTTARAPRALLPPTVIQGIRKRQGTERRIHCQELIGRYSAARERIRNRVTDIWPSWAANQVAHFDRVIVELEGWRDE